MSDRLLHYSRFIKIEHTLFALPILFSGALLAENPSLQVSLLGWIVLASFGARTFAMAINRILDRDLDRLNPRTAKRELPAGLLSLSEAWAIAAFGVIVYGIATLLIAPILLLWAPLPLLIFWIYPQLKRKTRWAHLGVGAGLACAPAGAWMAVSWRGFPVNSTWSSALLLSVFMFFWASGFDVIYATLDEAFDRAHGVFSLPAIAGREDALCISALWHALAFASLSLLYVTHFSTLWAGVLLAAIGGMLFLEHRYASDVDLSFFKINAIIGFLILAFVACGVYGL